MTKKEMLAKAEDRLLFYEKMMDKYITQGDFDMANSYCDELCGALYMLESLGLIDSDTRDARRKTAFDRYMAARFGDIKKDRPDAGTSERPVQGLASENDCKNTITHLFDGSKPQIQAGEEVSPE